MKPTILLSGIFRDVFLWSAPATRIRDFVFETELDAAYRDAEVTLTVDIAGKRPSRTMRVRYTLDDPEYIVTVPLFDEVLFKLSNGKTLIINTK